MALKNWKETVVAGLKQYKFVLLLVFLGLVFLLLPQSANQEEVHISQETGNILTVEQQLGNILSNVKGAGQVLVFLSQASGEEVLYQIDEKYRTTSDSSDSEITTVTVSGTDREESGLIRQVNPPAYLGAIIVCQGADINTVRLAIVEAVSRATGLGADKISVLKMR